ncbi:PNLIP [Cordylochernes scorpioides]|uniref:PNLIP n=1 Tax=Cordylochernes scorpioides TaxID=51811 RepID=A0ABY6KP83_9ARAC|nr:PNLIP [Cordylochernes scorpioides]
MDSRYHGIWMDEMAGALLSVEANVIIVDWSDGNYFPYPKAVANSRVVGADLGLLLHRLNILTGMSFKDVHLIGHSLGAHIAGYASKWRGNKVGRITGLDPSQPAFEGMPASVRLDRSDAYFVDVIHTSTARVLFLNFGFGIETPIGHVDFYPNGGKEQKGCTLLSVFYKWFTQGFWAGARELFSCSHQRSVEYFTESIKFDEQYCTPWAIKCNSHEEFLKGRCIDCGPDGSRCAAQGIKAIQHKRFIKSNSSNVFYLHMGSKSTFCRESLQLQVNGSELERSWVNLDISVYPEPYSGTIWNVKLKDWIASCYYNSWIGHLGEHVPGKIKSATFKWNYVSSWDTFWLRNTLDIDTVSVKKIAPKSEVQTLCVKRKDKPVRMDKCVTLTPCKT